MKAEFGGRNKRRILFQSRGLLTAPGVLFVHVGVEIREDLAHASGEIGILQTDAQFVIGDFAQDGDGVVIKVLPATRGQFGKDFLRALIPRPPEIVGEAIQACDKLSCFFGR